MRQSRPKCLGELKQIDPKLPSVREEMRQNLVRKLQHQEKMFPGMIGYDDTVIPGLINAILCGHNIILLGERGQGKSRIIRGLIDFLDDEIPAVEGCPIHDNPFAPICSMCRQRLNQLGDDLPITYVSKDKRLVEKLATPDVSTADLIGEVDPIKIAQGRTLDDEAAIHFGLVPRAHRGIFAVNELPDLAEKIQVAFFNIMEENDFQIKGFPVRLPLDILIVATANPEDYTNRGRIITPLKDRFDVQLRTHYPKRSQYEIQIMEQECRRFEIDGLKTHVPDFIKKILAEITFQARNSSEINQHSGVSCRVSICSYESVLGSAIHRCLQLGEGLAVPRITDMETAFPAVSGKIELEYEVPDKSGYDIIENLTQRAIKQVFDDHFDLDDLTAIISAFENGMAAEISRFQSSDTYIEGLRIIPGMDAAVARLVETNAAPLVASALEFILEGLHLSNKLNRKTQDRGVIYK